VAFDPGRPDLLGVALQKLSEDAGRVLALRRSARRLAVERYNAEAQANALVSLWSP
jgi:glycosyltransferase involved in cell wall biosynthesis